MKKLLFLNLLLSMLFAFGFDHKKNIPDPDITIEEQWVFSESEIKEILINHLKSNSVVVKNSKNAKIYVNDCSYRWYYTSIECTPSITIEVEYKTKSELKK